MPQANKNASNYSKIFIIHQQCQTMLNYAKFSMIYASLATLYVHFRGNTREFPRRMPLTTVFIKLLAIK